MSLALSKRLGLDRVPVAAWALGAYACLSIALYGHAVLADPAHIVVGSGPQPQFFGRDQSAFVWFLAYFAHAASHLQNPLVTHAVFVPRGYDLAWAAAIPGPSLLLMPLTLVAGPIVSYDVLALAAPAVAAWCTFLLARQLTARAAPAFAGGLLFGFGTYETINHVNLALVAMLPLAALLVLRRRAGLTSRRRFIAALGAILALQLWTSSEVLASMVGFGVVAFALAAVIGGRSRWAQTRTLAIETLVALVPAIALGAPFLYYSLRYPNPIAQVNAAGSGADLANFVIPTPASLLNTTGFYAHTARHLYGNLTEQAAYLGVPLLVLLAGFAVSFRTRPAGRLLVGVFAIAAITSLGSTVVVDGHWSGVTMPWSALDQLPLLRYASPTRFVVYAWLAAAVALACWLTLATHSRWRWALAVLALAAVAPNAAGLRWGTRVDSPPLLAGARLAHYVPRGAVVLALPFGMYGDSMFWQVEAHFDFRLAGGYLGSSLPSGYSKHGHVIHELEDFTAPSGPIKQELCALIRYTRSSVILLRDRRPGAWGRLLGPLQIAPIHAGGFAIYELGTRAGACGL